MSDDKAIVTNVEINNFGSVNHYGFADVTYRQYLNENNIGPTFDLVGSEIEAYTSMKAIIKCQYCGQWAARKTACKHCGGAVE